MKCAVLIAVLVAQTATAEPPTTPDAAFAALEKDPMDPGALRAVVGLASALGGLDAVIARARARADERPKDGRRRLVVGRVLWRSAGCVAALPEYDRATALSGEHTSVAWQATARCHEELGDAAKAIAAFEQSARSSKDKAGRQDALEAGITLALSAGRDADATRLWEALMATGPSDAFLRIGQAQRLARAGRLESALAMWVQVERLSGGDKKLELTAVKERAALLVRLGRHDESETLIRGALRGLPAEHWAELELYETLIAIYRGRGRLSELVQALSRDRRSYTALVLSARLWEELGEDGKAIAAYRKAVAERPANVDARAAILRLLERKGDKVALEAEYKALIKRVPDDPRYPIGLSDLYASLGKRDAALLLLDGLAKRHATDSAILELVVDALLRQRADRPRVERAFAALQRLEATDDRHVTQLGEYYHATGDKERAVATWRKLAEPPFVAKGADATNARVQLATLFAEHELLDLAERELDQAVRTAATTPSKLAAWRANARFLERTERPNDAAKAWAQVEALLGPADVDGLREARERQVALLEKRGGTGTDELQQLEKRLKDRPGDRATALLLAEAYVRRKDSKRALEALRSLDATSDREALRVLVRVHQLQGNAATVVDTLRRLAALDRGAARELLAELVKNAIENHQLTAAVRLAELGVALEPGIPEAELRLADALDRVGRSADALSQTRRALLAMPAGPAADAVRERLARLYERAGDRELARRELLTLVRDGTDPQLASLAARRLVAEASIAELEALEPLLGARGSGKVAQSTARRTLLSLYERHARLVQSSVADPAERLAALRRLGERASRVLAEALSEGDRAQKARAVRLGRVLQARGTASGILRLAADPDPLLASQALLSLGVLGVASPEAIAALGTATSATDGQMSSMAIIGLGLLPGPAAGAALLGQAKAAVTRIDRAVATALALGFRAAPEGIDLALELLAGPEIVRPVAAWALGAMGDVRVIERLATRYPLESEVTQRAIVWALGALASPQGWPTVLRAAASDSQLIATEARGSAVRIASKTRTTREAQLGTLARVVDVENAQIRFGSLWTVLVPPPAGTAEVPESALRAAIEAALGGSDGPLLTRLLRAPGLSVSSAARATLVPVVGRALAHRSPDVRVAAATWLGGAGASAVAPLVARLEDAHDGVRVAVAQALGRLGDGTARRALVDTLGRGGSTLSRVALLEALRGAGGSVDPAVIAAVSDAMPSVRRAALDTLAAASPSDAAVTAALGRIADPSIDVGLAALAVVRRANALDRASTVLEKARAPVRAAATVR